ncbi:hypothetical protein [Actinoplanes xinjiangensis]|uniref:hypothetical protein n=1 Tax=Actinoplanes xinjiangensis TaxID=512350 RepID=UPI003412A17C
MTRKSILVAGPRELPPAGLVSVWFDTGSGPGYSCQVWVADLEVSDEHDDGRSSHAIYALAIVECNG